MREIDEIPENITDTDLALADLQYAKEAAENALNFKNDYFAKISHEVRTPLNAVIGVADALIHHHGDENISPKLEIIQSAAVSILKILDKSLDHAKLEADKCELEPVTADPKKIVKSICTLWETKASQNNTAINCNIDDNVPDEIYFDAFRYEQCLNNLLSNAIKFTKDGHIDVILNVDHSTPSEPKLVLGVSDTGIGMDPEQQKLVFDAYAQADSSISRRFGGTGLGLNIVQNISQLMDGEIEVQSTLGKGTVFTLTIPITIPPSDIEEATQSDLDERPLTNLKILVVDDNAANHFVIQSLLENEIGGIVTAKSGASAIEALTVHRVDLVLMDIHMPEMDGIQTTLAIRGSKTPWANVPIIGVSADPQFQGREMGLEIGMEGVVEKPVMYNPLISSIRRALKSDSGVIPFEKTGT